MSLPKTPSFRVDGRKALVTGAGRGLARDWSSARLALFAPQTLEWFPEEPLSADVVLAARTGAEVDALADEIRATGGQAAGLALDVSDLEATRAAVSEHGPFQILVNNAGTNRPAFLQDITEDDYDLVTDLNVRSVVFLTQTVAKGLQDTGLSGSIINMASVVSSLKGAPISHPRWAMWVAQNVRSIAPPSTPSKALLRRWPGNWVQTAYV